MRTVLKVVAAAGLLGMTACASSGQHTGGPSYDENLITAAELLASPATNLRDYIQLHRPRWLERNYSAAMSSSRVQSLVVYLDNQRYGGPDALASMSTRGVEEVRYFSPSEAQARFGLGTLNGVIQVVTSK